MNGVGGGGHAEVNRKRESFGNGFTMSVNECDAEFTIFAKIGRIKKMERNARLGALNNL